MGSPSSDFRGFRALHLFRDLGLNVALLTLPFHGRRRGSRVGFPQVPGGDILDNVHGMSQAAWDARQLLRLVRLRTERPVGLMGIILPSTISALPSVRYKSAISFSVNGSEMVLMSASRVAASSGV